MTAVLDFAGKTVLVAGIGKRGQTGEAIVDAFADRGARLVLVGRSAESADQYVEVLRVRNIEAFGHGCDLTDAAALAALGNLVAAQAPTGVHGLVLLAGGYETSGPIEESDPAVWDHLMSINLATAYHTTRAFLPLVRQARGSLVYFSSASALPGGTVSGMSAYVAAKSGVLALMRAVAAEERGSGVRANALAPTAIRTASNLASMGTDMRYVDRETIAQWVLYLTDPSSGPVSGQAFRLG
ncbi:MAG: hypothetical protein MNPFHGCM_00065 [Gemmatimonadaceae bacterium]|nr:hypothetical protein [Gemmatimonadaceae bacterium]